MGRVKSLARTMRHVARSTHAIGTANLKEKILSPQKDGRGYLHVRLSREGKQYLSKVHVLVAEAFLGYDRKQYNRRNVNSLVIDHLDGVKTNNELSNLSICTQKENIKRYWDKGTTVTAISIPKNVFDEAEAEANSLGISRSRFYTEALKNYMHIKD